MDGTKRGGDEIYRFFRACADWPELIQHGQAISVEVWQIHPLWRKHVTCNCWHVRVLMVRL